MEGLQKMVRDFYSIVEDIKRRPYDLLDYGQNQFERDFLEFKVNIHDLELALQVSSLLWVKNDTLIEKGGLIEIPLFPLHLPTFPRACSPEGPS
jgi:Dynein heavy chain, N-terminal region 1